MCLFGLCSEKKNKLQLLDLVNLDYTTPVWDTSWQTYSGCVMFTSKIKSFGISNISGSSPAACRTKGRMSNLPPLPFHPRFIHTCWERLLKDFIVFKSFNTKQLLMLEAFA